MRCHRPAGIVWLVGAAVIFVAACQWAVPTRNVAPSAVLKLGKGTTELSKGQFCVSFDGSQSRDSFSEEDATGGVDAFIWDFGDGSPVATLLSTEPTPSNVDSSVCFRSNCDGTCAKAPQHIYTMPVGSVVLARLQIRDNDGALSEPAVLRVSLRTNRPPVARFAASPGTASLVASMDASGSSDPDPEDGERLHYFWSFGDDRCDPVAPCPFVASDAVCLTDKSTDRHQVIEHRYSAPGSYEVLLHVSDGEVCSGPAHQDVTVVVR